MVSTHQPDSTTAAAIRHFLLWTISLEGGNAPKYLDAVQFIPLPDASRAEREPDQPDLLTGLGDGATGWRMPACCPERHVLASAHHGTMQTLPTTTAFPLAGARDHAADAAASD